MVDVSEAKALLQELDDRVSEDRRSVPDQQLQSGSTRGSRSSSSSSSSSSSPSSGGSPSSSSRHGLHELGEMRRVLQERTADLEVAARLGEALLEENEALRIQLGRCRAVAEESASKKVERVRAYLEEAEQSNAKLSASLEEATSKLAATTDRETNLRARTEVLRQDLERAATDAAKWQAEAEAGQKHGRWLEQQLENAGIDGSRKVPLPEGRDSSPRPTKAAAAAAVAAAAQSRSLSEEEQEVAAMAAMEAASKDVARLTAELDACRAFAEQRVEEKTILQGKVAQLEQQLEQQLEEAAQSTSGVVGSGSVGGASRPLNWQGVAVAGEGPPPGGSSASSSAVPLPDLRAELQQVEALVGGELSAGGGDAGRGKSSVHQREDAELAARSGSGGSPPPSSEFTAAVAGLGSVVLSMTTTSTTGAAAGGGDDDNDDDRDDDDQEDAFDSAAEDEEDWARSPTAQRTKGDGAADALEGAASEYGKHGTHRKTNVKKKDKKAAGNVPSHRQQQQEQQQQSDPMLIHFTMTLQAVKINLISAPTKAGSPGQQHLQQRTRGVTSGFGSQLEAEQLNRLDAKELYAQALDDGVPFFEWADWIRGKLVEGVIVTAVREGRAGPEAVAEAAAATGHGASGAGGGGSSTTSRLRGVAAAASPAGPWANPLRALLSKLADR